MQRYDDILYLPHHVSVGHPRMSGAERAAQFSPFAALTGYDAAVRETARQTDEYVELDESKKFMLNERLRFVLERLEEQPEITITFFLPDERKKGGAYVSITGIVKKVDVLKRRIVLMDQTGIPIDQITEIDGACFSVIPET